jgi:hypothetical protein
LRKLSWKPSSHRRNRAKLVWLAYGISNRPAPNFFLRDCVQNFKPFLLQISAPSYLGSLVFLDTASHCRETLRRIRTSLGLKILKESLTHQPHRYPILARPAQKIHPTHLRRRFPFFLSFTTCPRSQKHLPQPPACLPRRIKTARRFLMN